MRKINIIPKPSMPKPVKTLDDLLSELEAKEIDKTDLKELIVEFIKETPDDKQDSKGYRARIRLEGLRLLADVMKLEGKEKDMDSSVLQLIKRNSEDETE
jgi:hypothetical protein